MKHELTPIYWTIFVLSINVMLLLLYVVFVNPKANQCQITEYKEAMYEVLDDYELNIVYE